MSDIVINKINKRFDDNDVLKNYSEKIEEGSIVCIMGPSGIGKSTLIRCLLGIEDVDSGSIEGIPEKISVMFQEDRLSEDYSVVNNIKMVLDESTCHKISDKKELKEEIRKHLEELGLGDAFNRKVRELSGGMKRRVALIRAMMYQSELVIMDEPFKGLDEETRKKAIEYVLKYRNGRTMIIITHDEEEVGYLGGRRVELW